jgi:hypothetical protein
MSSSIVSIGQIKTGQGRFPEKFRKFFSFSRQKQPTIFGDVDCAVGLQLCGELLFHLGKNGLRQGAIGGG